MYVYVICVCEMCVGCVWMCVCVCMCEFVCLDVCVSEVCVCVHVYLDVCVCVISYNALPLHSKSAFIIVTGLLSINVHVSQVFEPVCLTFKITSKFYLCY